MYVAGGASICLRALYGDWLTAVTSRALWQQSISLTVGLGITVSSLGPLLHRLPDPQPHRHHSPTGRLASAHAHPRPDPRPRTSRLPLDAGFESVD